MPASFMGLLFKWDLCQVILHFMFLNKWCWFARDCRVFAHKGLYFQHLWMTRFCFLFGQTSDTLKQQIGWTNYLTILICPLLENCCIGVVSILLVVTALKLSSKSHGLVRTITFFNYSVKKNLTKSEFFFNLSFLSGFLWLFIDSKMWLIT